MQVLFLWDTNNEPSDGEARQVLQDGTDDQTLREAALTMARGAWQQRGVIDARLEQHTAVATAPSARGRSEPVAAGGMGIDQYADAAKGRHRRSH